MVTNLFRKDRTNVGDFNCSPLLYFHFPFQTQAMDALENRGDIENIIIGCGGMILNRDPFKLGDAVRRAVKAVSWGIGHNSVGGTEPDWPDWMKSFALHGVRDFGTPFEWVPCASCMNPVLDTQREPIFEAVIFEHKAYPIALPDVPRMRNKSASMEDAVNFILMGETLLTNSYHGAYWGLLLRRKVVIVAPFSTKFHAFKHQPKIESLDRWREAAQQTQPFDILDEYRDRNRWHFERVCQHFEAA